MHPNAKPKAFWAYTTGNAAMAAAELGIVQASRPMKPPAGLLPERVATAGALAARRELARAGRSIATRGDDADDDGAESDSPLTLVNPH